MRGGEKSSCDSLTVVELTLRAIVISKSNFDGRSHDFLYFLDLKQVVLLRPRQAEFRMKSRRRLSVQILTLRSEPLVKTVDHSIHKGRTELQIMRLTPASIFTNLDVF